MYWKYKLSSCILIAIPMNFCPRNKICSMTFKRNWSRRNNSFFHFQFKLYILFRYSTIDKNCEKMISDNKIRRNYLFFCLTSMQKNTVRCHAKCHFSWADEKKVHKMDKFGMVSEPANYNHIEKYLKSKQEMNWPYNLDDFRPE